MKSRFYQQRVNAACRFDRPDICRGCPGHPDSDSHNPMFSGGFIRPSGPLDALMMLIGIAGGAEEEERGEPLVGPSGRKINAVIRWAAEEMGVSSLPIRKYNVYNCRATTTGYGGKIVNRKSGGMTVKELRSCASRWLFPELRKTKAKVVLILGTEAYSFIMNKRFDIFGKAMGHRLYIPQEGISREGLGETIYCFGEEFDWADDLYEQRERVSKAELYRGRR